MEVFRKNTSAPNDHIIDALAQRQGSLAKMSRNLKVKSGPVPAGSHMVIDDTSATMKDFFSMEGNPNGHEGDGAGPGANANGAPGGTHRIGRIWETEGDGTRWKQ